MKLNDKDIANLCKILRYAQDAILNELNTGKNERTLILENLMTDAIILEDKLTK